MYFVPSTFIKKNFLKNIIPLKIKSAHLKIILIPVCFPIQLGKNLHSQVKSQYEITFKYKSSISSISSIEVATLCKMDNLLPCMHLAVSLMAWFL